ncbi:MAG TPA: response regulator [Polyangiales bacterium]|nr:response regulator [Polyangiales bacterium]
MQLPNPRPRGRVLLIDDDEASQERIRELLRRGGYEVLSLSSPIGATQLIARENVAAVVVEMSSPVMQGPRFAALLASWERVRDLPLIVISDQSDKARASIAQVKRVAVTSRELVEQTLLRTVDRAIALRGGTGPSQSGVVPVRPTVRHFARAALDAWQAFLSGRSVGLATVVGQFINLRSETLAIGLEQTTELVSIAIELIERADTPRNVAVGLDHTVIELLEWLITLEPDKGRAFDRSLALNLHRARLEAAREG